MTSCTRVTRSLAMAALAAATLWPADAAAQHRGGRRGPVRTVLVRTYPPYAAYDRVPLYSMWYGYQYRPYPPYPVYFQRPGTDLRIQVTPREAEVYLDGYLVGTVDDFDGVFQRLRVPFGEHTVSIYREGYRTITEKMLFRPYESYHLKQVMEPLAAGDAAEPRPAPGGRAPGGTAAPAPRPGAAAAGPIVDRRTGGFGTLAIRVQPRDAVVLVDGERWNTPSGGEPLLVELAEGAHEVEIRRDGHRPYSATVRIQAGAAETLNVSLPADR